MFECSSSLHSDGHPYNVHSQEIFPGFQTKQINCRAVPCSTKNIPAANKCWSTSSDWSIERSDGSCIRRSGIIVVVSVRTIRCIVISIRCIGTIEVSVTHVMCCDTQSCNQQYKHTSQIHCPILPDKTEIIIKHI